MVLSLKNYFGINSFYDNRHIIMKKVKKLLAGVLLSCPFIVFGFGASKVEAKEYRILILPSGGATGIIPATLLAEMEEKTGRPIYKLFDEIWGSSIGAMTAALLTTPKNGVDDRAFSSSTYDDFGTEPRSAAEVANFIENTFASTYRSANIRGIFSKLIGSSTQLKDTLIPIRILAAEVTDWWFGLMPKETELARFCRESSAELSLSQIACASCTVPPVHRTQPVLLGDGKCSYYLDAGHELCGNKACMNPLRAFLKPFSETIDLKNDTITLFFLGNGWVNFDSSSYGMKPLKILINSDAKLRIFENTTSEEYQGHPLIPVNMFNISVDLDPVLQEWKEKTWMGWMIRPFRSEMIDYNCAGMGFGPTLMMKKIAEDIASGNHTSSDVFQAMVNYLIQSESSLQR